MSARDYFRPLVQSGPVRPPDALPLAGGWCWVSEVEVLRRHAEAEIIPVSDLPESERRALAAPRAPMAGMTFAQPRIMGILNATPDSFSDGGQHHAAQDAIRSGMAMAGAGVDILDIGGESTRPGAAFVEIEEEIARTAPVLQGLRAAGFEGPLSIDTRKAPVAQAALAAGASLINDVSGFTFDDTLAPLAATQAVPVCVMHAQGDPATMQNDPAYDDVLLDVYDFLESQIAMLVGKGIPASRIIADPGIGFGKTLTHNLALLARLSLFHTLGVSILLGASRKRFIGTIGDEPDAAARAPGSMAVALAGIAQGVQIVRVHDVAQTCQAVALWQAATTGRQA